MVIPRWAAQFPDLIVAQSERTGGVSPVPFDSLNLGRYTEDDPANVRENRRLFARALGVESGQLSGGRQVHGAEVKRVEKAEECTGFDAFVSNVPGTILTVTVADCVPVLLYDPQRRAWGAAHAGWRGTVAQVVSRTLTALEAQFGSRPADCFAYVGTCISGPNFEVSRDVAEQFAPAFVQGGFANDKYRVDLKAANAAQLLAGGVREGQIEISPYCTVADNERFFSYRKAGGQTGRTLGVIGLGH